MPNSRRRRGGGGSNNGNKSNSNGGSAGSGGDNGGRGNNTASSSTSSLSTAKKSKWKTMSEQELRQEASLVVSTSVNVRSLNQDELTYLLLKEVDGANLAGELAVVNGLTSTKGMPLNGEVVRCTDFVNGRYVGRRVDKTTLRILDKAPLLIDSKILTPLENISDSSFVEAGGAKQLGSGSSSSDDDPPPLAVSSRGGVGGGSTNGSSGGGGRNNSGASQHGGRRQPIPPAPVRTISEEDGNYNYNGNDTAALFAHQSDDDDDKEVISSDDDDDDSPPPLEGRATYGGFPSSSSSSDSDERTPWEAQRSPKNQPKTPSGGQQSTSDSDDSENGPPPHMIRPTNQQSDLSDRSPPNGDGDDNGWKTESGDDDPPPLVHRADGVQSTSSDEDDSFDDSESDASNQNRSDKVGKEPRGPSPKQLPPPSPNRTPFGPSRAQQPSDNKSETANGVTASTKKKKNRRKKKKRSKASDAAAFGSDSEDESYDGTRNATSSLTVLKDNASRAKIELVEDACDWLKTQPFKGQKDFDKRKIQAPGRFKELMDPNHRAKQMSLASLVEVLFPSTGENLENSYQRDPLWILANQDTTSGLLERILDEDSAIPTFVQDHIQSQKHCLLALACEGGRRKDVKVLFSTQAVIPVPAKLVPKLLQNAIYGIGEPGFCNFVGALIKEIQLDKMDDEKRVRQVFKNEYSLGKKAKAAIEKALVAARKKLEEKQKIAKAKKKADAQNGTVKSTASQESSSQEAFKTEDTQSELPRQVDEFQIIQNEIDASMKWYFERKQTMAAPPTLTEEEVDPDNVEEVVSELPQTQQPGEPSCTHAKAPAMLADEIAAALDMCDDLPEHEALDQVNTIETSLDLSKWNENSMWVVELTEQAHKFFRKHQKKEHALCDKVLRRLQLLATGRWPYVLCKPVRTGSGKANLYETKIDKSRRIIWEVSVSFSPRRSKAGKQYAEQTIKVWDIVSDHDRLSRDIDQALQRIEKSYKRGHECIMYSQLKGLGKSGGVGAKSKSDDGAIVPLTFEMKQNFVPENVTPSSISNDEAYFAPANHDDNSFNLTKFYEVNASAVSVLLDSSTVDIDLPFVPGPKEHEIIQKDTSQSLLLMGRSGTGKTTVLVFRMFSQYKNYCEKMEEVPRQLFVTKNHVLKSEVQRSFLSMTNHQEKKMQDGENEDGAIQFPLFMSSAEWLETLDFQLPGTNFFSETEFQARVRTRFSGGDDTVQRGMQELLANADKGAEDLDEKYEVVRQEMNFGAFRSLWPKVNSRVKTKFDPSLVWLEIITHIKGSMASLRVESESTEARSFLSRQEYLNLPRKQSRLDRPTRQVVYDLYERYEEVKKKHHYYDAMDLVHSIARRIPAFLRSNAYRDKTSLLPVDSIFCDEVQDFTQVEIWLLAKLAKSPNNIMLAGDTAQSIAVGVGFRFVDCRQVLYESFSGTQPVLEKLCENYRSHSGVLQLAASVVELLYRFFSDSLDRLPPDFGLFQGPKPILMKAGSIEDLVLMLVGSERDTSRIEFGAHQVVLVRDEEAKKRIPKEFEIDRDWVMTIAESKGLEFDDVLLLDFFQDSKAEDLWRVVSSYTKEEVESYFSSCTNDMTNIAESTSAGVPTSFHWDDINPSDQTRDLIFDSDEHKILEGELKMLYTAITRSRVKVFIAETDQNSYGKAMFNYWRRRRLVDESGAGDEIQIMGKTNTRQEWADRGAYYYRMAKGRVSDQSSAALRLAVKCFEKGGEIEKRDQAKAYLAFAEFDEAYKQVQGRRAARQFNSAEFKRRSYDVAMQLIQTKDMELLGRAGLCLARIGPEESKRAAQIFELHGLMHYREFGHHLSKPVDAEIESFIYASRLFERSGNYVDAWRCLIASGGEKELKRAKSLILKHFDLFSKDSFKHVAVSWNGEKNDAVKYWKQKSNDKTISAISLAVTYVAETAARAFYKNGDEASLLLALSTISSISDRIQLCQTLDVNLQQRLGKLPWSRDLVATRGHEAGTNRTESGIDLGHLISSKLGGGEEAAGFLESRGQLLSAADKLSALEYSMEHRPKVFRLKSFYLELMAELPEKSRQDHMTSIETLAKSLARDMDEVPDLQPREKAALFLSIAKLKSSDPREAVNAFKLCKASKHTLLLSDALALIVQQRNATKTLASKAVTGSDDVWAHFILVSNTIEQMQEMSRDLRANTGKLHSISQGEAYFHLDPVPHDPKLLVTHAATNVRVSKAFKDAKMDLPVVPSAASSSLMTAIEKKTTYEVIALCVWMRSLELLDYYSNHLDFEMPISCPFMRVGLSCKCEGPHSAQDQALFYQMTQVRALVSQAMIAGCTTGKSLFPDATFDHSLRDAESTRRQCLAVLEKVVSRSVAPVKLFMPMDSTERKTIMDRLAQGSSSLFLTTGVVELMYDDQRHHWANLELVKQKSSLEELVRLWSLSAAAKQDKGLSSQFNKLEDVVTASSDISKGDKFYYIESRTKLDGKMLKSVDHVFRFFRWAIDARNLFNTVQLLNQLMKITLAVPRVITLSKLDQLSFLEYSTSSLLSLISLRYNRPGLWLVLPRELYLQSYVSPVCESSLCFRGVGYLDRSLLKTVSDRRQNSQFFEKVVVLLESTILCLLQSNCLNTKPSDPESELILVRAMVLGVSIVVNACILHRMGNSLLDKGGAQTNSYILPKYPLSGNISQLVTQMSGVLRFESKSEMMQNFPASLFDPSSNVAGLLNGTNALLKEAIGDRLSLFRILPSAENTNGVAVSEFDINERKTDPLKPLLTGIPINEVQEAAKNRGKNPCDDFLECVKIFSKNSFDQRRGGSSMDLSSKEIADMARHVDEKEAHAVIARAARRYIHGDLGMERLTCEGRIARMKTRRTILTRFVAVVAQKVVIARKLDLFTWDDSAETISMVPNPWKDAANVVASRRKWRGLLRQKAVFSLEASASEHHGKKPKRPEYEKHLLQYGRLASDCEFSRILLEGLLRVCENNTKSGGSNTRFWLGVHKEAEVEVNSSNEQLAKIVGMFEKNNFRLKLEQKKRMQSIRADVGLFLQTKVEEQERLLVGGKDDEDEYAYDGDKDDFEDPYDDFGDVGWNGGRKGR